jgi:CRISPR-associated protein Cas1
MLPHEGQRGGSRSAEEGFVTADMCAQYVYCPRRFHLVYVEGRWADNEYTDEGTDAHRRLESLDGILPDPADVEAPKVVRSVSLESAKLRLRAKLDLVELAPAGEATLAVPVEFKRGSEAPTPEKTWEPERVQLMVQGLLLREHGHEAPQGLVYYAKSRRRVPVPFTPELEARTLEVRDAVLHALAARHLPPPVEEERRCNGCSLAGICLPDETRALAILAEGGTPPGEVRRLYPARDDAVPLYVQEQGAFVGKEGESLVVSKGKERLAKVRLLDVSQLVLCGSISISPAAMHLLCEAGIPVVHLSMGHWFYGLTAGITLRNAFDRAAQYRKADDAAFCLQLSKAFVIAKASNQRTLLKRNHKGVPESVFDEMTHLIQLAGAADSIESLLGYEGNVARLYFGNLGAMLRPRAADDWPSFEFTHRQRRPPRDPVNSMLSFAYALLVKECTVALLTAGLDPYWGFFHRPRHGRPALALDLMEELRPVLADSAVLAAINNGMVERSDFEITAAGCTMTAAGRKALIRAFECRLDQLATHPIFDYRCSWRRLISLQATLLSRALRGDVAQYVGLTPR